MSTPNPLAPQGSLLEKQAKSKSSLQVAALIVGLHVVVLGGFLILGCKREDTKLPDASATTDTFTNSVPLLPDTNAPVTGEVSTNGLGIGAAPLGSSLPPLGGYTNADPTPAPAPAPVIPASEPTATATSASEYKVQKGDIAFNLAKKHGVTLKALKEANPSVDLAKLKVGQTIQIPASSGASMASHKSTAAAGESMAMGDGTTYTVKGGDNLIKIAKRTGSTVKAIRAANGLKSNNIKVGQKLKIPGKAAEAAPAP
ncbi:MAG TPA: LysM peptidoglycan-binding domain-containing protein, partial [Candidatus Limnocylindria bacterium]|nr:LysM peptidoglycan-binding domain-containing protein [Candidatus Limnocylindria bacterium]